MIRAYTQRLLPPYSGVVLIAETNRARAQSFDGINWDIQYLPGDSPAGDGYEREQGYALDRSYFRVAHIYEKELETYIFPVHLDVAEVTASIHELSEFLSTAKVPFPIADLYEYWLLDGADESPLALIFSCCTESQMATYPVRVNWTALPHSKMRVENTAGEQARRESPVNDRFQRLISSRAGVKPKAAWFKRHPGESDDFPPFLVREDWEHAEDRDLCQRYLHRKSPRLLMLQGIPHADRERMEIAAKDYALEVDDYFALYPEVNDEQRMSAIRVEARLRRHLPEHLKPKQKSKSDGMTPLSKDQRILE
ncbi:MAG: hypothetical protein P8Y83_09985 [Gammaproteobacteria bacterium]